MGYESKIYIVEKSSRSKESGEKRYASVIAMFNMCKFGAFGDIFTKETDCYIYADDGNTEILEDNYGEPLKEADIEDVIEYLENYETTNDYYRRVAPLLALLKNLDPGKWKDISVLHYGH